MRIRTSGNMRVNFEHSKAVCPEDGELRHALEDHLRSEHDMSPQEYLSRYGRRATLFGGEVFKTFYDIDVERKGNRSHHTYVTIGNIDIRTKEGEPSRIPMRPKGYKYPEKGKAGKACQRVARAVKYGRSVYLYGPAGTGKSDLFRAMAHDLNLEFSLYAMGEHLDPAIYFGKEAVVIDKETGLNKTEFIPGMLLRDIQGRVGKDGIRRPVMITVDDIDRAPAEAHEIFRHILDGAKSVFVPELGENIPVFPGTVVVATANSRGRGDDYGFYSSIQREGIDDSILDRFHRFIEYHFLDADEEQAILEEKFPYIKKHAPEAFTYMMDVCKTLRFMIENKEAYFSFSHRRLEDWARSISELIREAGDQFEKAMVGQAAVDWLERYDEDIRASVVERALKVYLPPDHEV